MSAAVIARRLGGQRQGNNWRCACPLECGYSLSLSDGEDGKLLAYCFGGHEYHEILAALVEFGLLDDDAGDDLHVSRRVIVCQRDVAKRIAHARQVYDSGVLDERIQIYLRSRGIELVSPVLRFAEHAPHRLGARFPAMLAPVVNAAGEQTGVHMTYLRHDGSGKADLPKDFQRECRGVIHRGAIRLTKHDPDTALIIGEGIESTFAATQIFGLAGWSAVFAGGLKTVELPWTVRTIIIAADNDVSGAGQRNAVAAYDRWTSEGRAVRIADAAAAASCPVDYVAAPLLSSVSTLIGHARWAQAWPGWSEPPHLWLVAVGDSGTGKSPGADCLLRDVLPEIERRMIGDYPDRLREWQAAVEFDKIVKKNWQDALRAAQENKKPLPPIPLPTASDLAPEKPRLRQHDVTIEQVGALLAAAAPKGMMIVRDEISGWLTGMAAYNPAGRAFWLEAYGGRPYRVERRKHGGEPIEIERLAVSVYGGTQPERLSELATGPDDGLFSRVLWAWPDPVPFRRGSTTPGAAWAIEALDRLRELDLAPGNPPNPIFIPLVPDARPLMEEFSIEMEARLSRSGGLLRSAFGKARGAALRLSLVLEWMWCCAKPDMPLPPDSISKEAFTAAAALVESYFMPMAERIFGDAGASDIERNAATLARWVLEERPHDVHVRRLLREVRLPGLRSAEQIKAAAKVLVEADWLRAPIIGFGAQRKVVYAINPRLWGAS